jgi:hypothetical protein
MGKLPAFVEPKCSSFCYQTPVTGPFRLNFFIICQALDPNTSFTEDWICILSPDLSNVASQYGYITHPFVYPCNTHHPYVVHSVLPNSTQHLFSILFPGLQSGIFNAALQNSVFVFQSPPPRHTHTHTHTQTHARARAPFSVHLITLRDFRLPPRCRRNRRSSGVLRSVEW